MKTAPAELALLVRLIYGPISTFLIDMYEWERIWYLQLFHLKTGCALFKWPILKTGTAWWVVGWHGICPPSVVSRTPLQLRQNIYSADWTKTLEKGHCRQTQKSAGSSGLWRPMNRREKFNFLSWNVQRPFWFVLLSKQASGIYFAFGVFEYRKLTPISFACISFSAYGIKRGIPRCPFSNLAQLGVQVT